eukprot:TRINITY_DN23029_c0_g1_i1.p1 TRINITY_DN23029_c0_g1~~TRINITY_DN23029_c0_g1_i1.p1  ORF type:complete len:1171 (-),score=203.23 TRINITY_DN23029_c0_g1_i1:29-3394(-)
MQASESLHVCIVGDVGCGHGEFLRCYQAAYGGSADGTPAPRHIESFTAIVEVAGQPFRVRFTDNAAAECFEGVEKVALGTAHVVLICFAAEKPETLENVERVWLPLLREADTEAPVYFLGLHFDMRAKTKAASAKADDQASEMAQYLGAFGYLKASVHHPETVVHSVSEALEAAREFYGHQWQLGPRREALFGSGGGGNEPVMRDLRADGAVTEEDGPIARHERINLCEDPVCLEVETLYERLSNIGYTPSRQHAYLRADLSSLALTSVAALRGYKHLQFLNLSGNRLRTLEPLGELTSLLHLNASFNLLIRTQSMTAPDALETIDLSYNMISDMGDWHVHRYLRELNLRGNFIDRIGLGLKKNFELRMLDFSENFLARIENLENLGLRTLYVAQNRLSSLEGVSTLTKLQVLNARHNNITSLSALRSQDLPRLRRCCVADNRLSKMSEVEGLAAFEFLCDVFLAPNPVAELPHYRAQVLHRMPRLRSLDGERATAEEKIKADLIYGADVEMRREIFEKLLPEETFVDRRLVTEEGIAAMEGETFGLQGDAGPYGSADAWMQKEGAASKPRTRFEEAVIRRRLASTRAGGSPLGSADFCTFSAPFVAPIIVDSDIREILEACFESRIESLYLCRAQLSVAGILELLAFVHEVPPSLRFVDLSGCQAVGEGAREVLTSFPYSSGLSMEASDCGLSDLEEQRLRNQSSLAQEALRRIDEERQRSDAMCEAYLGHQGVLEEFAEDNRFAEGAEPPVPRHPFYSPLRWQTDVGVELGTERVGAFLDKNPQGMGYLDAGDEEEFSTVVLKDGTTRRLDQLEVRDLRRQRDEMFRECGFGEYVDYYEGEIDPEAEMGRPSVQLPPAYEEAFDPVLGEKLLGFMVWEGVEPNQDRVEVERARIARLREAWLGQNERCKELKRACEAIYDKPPMVGGAARPENVASGMIMAHFTYLCSPKPIEQGVPLVVPGQFRFKRISEVPRAPPRRGEDLLDLAVRGAVVIESITGTGFGRDSVQITLVNKSDTKELTVAIRQGTIFQHVDWEHRQNLMAKIEFLVVLPPGGIVRKRLDCYCLNVTCACSNGNKMSLTEFYIDDPEALSSQCAVWKHVEGLIAQALAPPPELGAAA